MRDMSPTTLPDLPIDETVDAFHRGAFYVVQPKGRGHRSGMDAMMLASMVAVKKTQGQQTLRVADLGAGAGAAGMAVAVRLPQAEICLVERSAFMLTYAQKSLNLPQNAGFAARLHLLQADIALRGRARVAQGLKDEAFDHVIMNPPFNDGRDRLTPDDVKAEAHAMTETLFEDWMRTASAILKPGGQLSLIARPHSVGEIIAASANRFGGLECTLIHPRPKEPAIRLLVSAIKGSRARPIFRHGLVMHGDEGHAFSPDVDAYNNGMEAYNRLDAKA